MNIAIILLLAFLGGSYHWAMRGTILGGQKGAMLPGAFLGLLIPLATGSQYLIDNMWIFTAVGGAAMFFGGTQTYGDTLTLAMDKKNMTYKTTGRVGMFIKGGTWFGIFAGIIAIAFNAMIGEYKPLELVIFVALIPVCKWLGFLVLNFPQSPKKGKFPIFYFSKDAFEMWGGMSFVVLQIIVFAIVKQDWFIFTMTLAGFFSGAIGNTLGVAMMYSVKWGKENNRYIFGKLQKSGYVSGWKVMEFSLGAAGALGTLLCFILTYPKEKLTEFEAKGISAINLGDDTVKWLTIAWLVCTAIYCILSILPDVSKTENNKKVYALRTAIEFFTDEVFHWFVLAYLGILLPLLGCTFVAKLLSVGIIFWVVTEKFVKKGYHKKVFTNLVPFKVIMIVVAIAIFALQFVTEITGLFEFTPFALFAYYLLSYEILETIIVLAPMGEIRGFKKFKEAGIRPEAITVRTFSWFEVAVCLIIGALIMF
ncbi:MAG: hypothetical protein IJD88_03875 [Clostridia bacterium]|nr:hypothetical protein [Clostridia bacterium]